MSRSEESRYEQLQQEKQRCLRQKESLGAEFHRLQQAANAALLYDPENREHVQRALDQRANEHAYQIVYANLHQIDADIDIEREKIAERERGDVAPKPVEADPATKVEPAKDLDWYKRGVRSERGPDRDGPERDR